MYKALQEEAFQWLKNKHDKDRNFTFSLRQKANKGAELNYFIGTEKSRYFSTTFWYIPVAYPGSSGDLINLVFTITRNKKIEFHLQFNQTKNPHNEQNAYALEFIQSIKPLFKEIFPDGIYAPDTNKMEFFGAYSKPIYNSFEELKDDLEIFLNKIFPIVDQQILALKVKYPSFIAHRFSMDDQEKMFKKMEERFEKYKVIEDLTEELEEEEELIMVDTEVEHTIPLNQILYGPPGTGKTYNTINKAISIANPDYNLEQDREILKAEYQRLVEKGQIVFTTFHQSMSYEDFIEGIKPEVRDHNVLYDVKDGLFKLIASKAKDNWISSNISDSKISFDEAFQNLREEWEEDNDLQFSLTKNGYEFTILGFTDTSISFRKASGGTGHTLSVNTLRDYFYNYRELTSRGLGKYYTPVLKKIKSYASKEAPSKITKKFVLIIDEINRGNVSQIFGELITLIEENKRLGNPEALEIVLPYSKEKFGVPSNLYIIGTMNTADRSVEALDTALRRRFSFQEMMPKTDVIEKEELNDFPRVEIMQKINTRIELLLDRNYTLGHSYFLKDDFRASFKNEIIPLLQEYFYNDCGKIGLILGRGFVRVKESGGGSSNSPFADFDTKNEFEVMKSYELIPFEEVDFETAIETLLT